MADVLSLTLDVAEPGITHDRMVVRCDGMGWDYLQGEGYFVDDNTLTAMLVPAPYLPDWDTTATGIYARLAKASYTLTTPANWVDHSFKFAGDNYLYSLGANEGVQTAATYPKNQPFVLSFVNHGRGNADYAQIEFAWGPTGAGNVGARVWNSGKVDIFKGANIVGQGSLSAENDRIDHRKIRFRRQGHGRSLSDQAVDLLVFPWRKRELGIFTNQGASFSHVFEDLDPAAVDPTIVAAGHFEWGVRSAVDGTPVQAMVQLAPMRFATAGYLLSKVRTLPRAPGAGETPTFTVHYDTPGYGTVAATASLVLPDGVTPFVPDGTLTQCRLRVDMTGDGAASPWVYGAEAVFPAITTNTDSAHATNIINFVTAAELSVPDSPADVRLRLTIKNPAYLEAHGTSKLRIIGNRPVNAQIGTISILKGRADPPRYTQAIDDTSDRLVMECEDRWKQMRNYHMDAVTPLDGLTLAAAVEQMVTMAGFPSADCDIQTTPALTLDSAGQASKGQWNLIPEYGDTPAQWLEKLWQDYAQTWFMGWYPSATGPKFRFRSGESIGTTADVTLWPKIEDAVAGLIAAGDDEATARAKAPFHVYNGYDETILEPAANEVRLRYYDSGTCKVGEVFYRDAASQTVDTVPADKPDTWLGERRLYGMFNPAITTQALAESVLTIMAQRLTLQRKPAEWHSQMLFKADGSPVWRGNVVNLVGHGRFRVLTLQGGFERECPDSDAEDEVDDSIIWRPFNYTGQWIGASE